MTVGEIIQRVKNLYARGTPADENRLTDRHIYSKLLTSRSLLLSQMAHKKQYLSDWNYQIIDCIELIPAKPYECDCLDIGCDVLRTKYPLPKPLTNLDKNLISTVSSIDGKIQYSETTWNSMKYQFANKYTGGKPYYFIKNKYLYLYNVRHLKVISVRGIFEDPIEAENFPSYCWDENHVPDCGKMVLNMEFPMDNDKIDTLIEMAVNELVVAFGQMVEDGVNDSRDKGLVISD
jgi:hypothetical protein